MKKIVLYKLIIYGAITVLLLFSLIFSKNIEYALLLKPNLSMIEQNTFEIHFVNVGQGDATLVKFVDGTTMLVDAGTSAYESKLTNYIDNVFFRNTKEKIFDFVVLTHSEVDHCGNMPTILEKYKIKTFVRPNIFVNDLDKNLIDGKCKYDNNIVYAKTIKYLYDKNINTIIASQNEKLSDKVTILSPMKNYYSNINDYSCVLRIDDGGFKTMLMGDASSDIETDIINSYDENYLDIDILKIGHHGSNTSTSLDFLNITKPSYAVISLGSNNSYDFPSKETLDNITSFNQNHINKISVSQTDKDGNIIYFSDNGSIGNDNIKDVDKYLFLSWWIVVIILIFVIGIGMFINDFINIFNKNKATNVRYTN